MDYKITYGNVKLAEVNVCVKSVCLLHQCFPNSNVHIAPLRSCETADSDSEILGHGLRVSLHRELHIMIIPVITMAAPFIGHLLCVN